MPVQKVIRGHLVYRRGTGIGCWTDCARVSTSIPFQKANEECGGPKRDKIPFQECKKETAKGLATMGNDRHDGQRSSLGGMVRIRRPRLIKSPKHDCNPKALLDAPAHTRAGMHTAGVYLTRSREVDARLSTFVQHIDQNVAAGGNERSPGLKN